MIREVAGFDPARAQQVLDWPLRETLLSYVQVMKAAAAVQYRHDVAVWASLAPHAKKQSKPPRVPLILRPEHRRSKPDGG
jgi:hypothetical protein